jgi:hypothetical protein
MEYANFSFPMGLPSGTEVTDADGWTIEAEELGERVIGNQTNIYILDPGEEINDDDLEATDTGCSAPNGVRCGAGLPLVFPKTDDSPNWFVINVTIVPNRPPDEDETFV